MIYKVLFLALVVGCISAATTNNDDGKDVGSLIPVPVLSSTPSSNATTTDKPTSTSPSPTTKPPTPTTTPKTTTTPSTTTTTTTTTTNKPTPAPSPAPNTTTTAKPTTTAPPTSTSPKPSPTPIPPQPKEPIPGTWSVNYTDSNRTCVVITLAAQLEIPYNISKTNNTGYINITPNATATGSCGNLLQSIKLQWKNNLNVTNNVTFTFKRNTVNSTKFDLAKIEIAVTADNSTLPGYNGTFALVENNPLFNTSLQHSYKCYKRQTFNLTNDNSNVTAGFIHLQHVQLQAFRNTTGTVFAEAEDCAPRETPDVVPIAVGCALIALIIIVLAAYLIGRRRNQARGYLSMFSAEKKEEDYIPMKNLNCFK